MPDWSSYSWIAGCASRRRTSTRRGPNTSALGVPANVPRGARWPVCHVDSCSAAAISVGGSIIAVKNRPFPSGDSDSALPT
jgi:hypothetical protein